MGDEFPALRGRRRAKEVSKTQEVCLFVARQNGLAFAFSPFLASEASTKQHCFERLYLNWLKVLSILIGHLPGARWWLQEQKKGLVGSTPT